MSELPDSLKDVNSVLKRGREVLNVIEPKLKHCNVAAVMCNKIYTQAELQQEKMKLIQWIYDCDYLNEDGVRAFETMPELKQRISQDGE